MCRHEISLRKRINIKLMFIKIDPYIALLPTKLTRIFLQKIRHRKAIYFGSMKASEKANRLAQYLFFGIQLISHVVISDKPTRVQTWRDQSVRKFI